ncbi:hypothetical protein TNCV_3083711 [Trichonephila clavipes]|nr:hypothetical protein TNCV_3083711 [Trichonephila clavipes]
MRHPQNPEGMSRKSCSECRNEKTGGGSRREEAPRSRFLVAAIYNEAARILLQRKSCVGSTLDARDYRWGHWKLRISALGELKEEVYCYFPIAGVKVTDSSLAHRDSSLVPLGTQCVEGASLG